MCILSEEYAPILIKNLLHLLTFAHLKEDKQLTIIITVPKGFLCKGDYFSK